MLQSELIDTGAPETKEAQCQGIALHPIREACTRSMATSGNGARGRQILKVFDLIGGAEEDRTPDLCSAIGSDAFGRSAIFRHVHINYLIFSEI